VFVRLRSAPGQHQPQHQAPSQLGHRQIMLSDTTTKIAARKQIRESETDLAGRIFALQRRTNRCVLSSAISPHQRISTVIQGSHPTQEPPMLSTSPRKHAPHLIRRRRFLLPFENNCSPPSNRNYFQNRLNHAAQATKSPTLSHAGRLFNPNTDSIPPRHTAEPEVMSDTDFYAPRGGHSGRQLFTPRKDDPIPFSIRSRRHPEHTACYSPASSHEPTVHIPHPLHRLSRPTSPARWHDEST
jgi:hypothetical protein